MTDYIITIKTLKNIGIIGKSSATIPSPELRCMPKEQMYY